jgi:hypothetical protein
MKVSGFHPSIDLSHRLNCTSQSRSFIANYPTSGFGHSWSAGQEHAGEHRYRSFGPLNVGERDSMQASSKQLDTVENAHAPILFAGLAYAAIF